MATAQDLIDQAMRRINVLASGETPTTQERNDGLVTLNQLLASWSAQLLPIPFLSFEGFALLGASSYTIGPTSFFATVRPLHIKKAFVQNGALSKSPEIITTEKWASIKDRSRTGKLAEFLHYTQLTDQIGNIDLWPAPIAGGTLTLYSYKPLTNLATLLTAVQLPPGYERAIVTCLALEMAPEFGAAVPDELVKQAEDAKVSIFGLNAALYGPPQSHAPAETAPAPEAA